MSETYTLSVLLMHQHPERLPQRRHHIFTPAADLGDVDRHSSTLQGHFLEGTFLWPALSHLALPACRGGWEVSLEFLMADRALFLRKEK